MNPLPKITIRVIGDTAHKATHTQSVFVPHVDEFLNASNLAPSSKRIYRHEIEQFAYWVSKPWCDVTSHDCATYKNYLKNAPIDTSKLKHIKDQLGNLVEPNPKLPEPSTINRSIAALRAFFKWLKATGYIDRETIPTAGLKFEKLPALQSRQIEPHHMNAIYGAIQGCRPKDIRDRALLAVLINGLRAEDISQLNIGSYQDRSLCFIRKKGKNEANIPIEDSWCQVIDEYLEYRRGTGESMEAGEPLFLAVPPHPPKRLGYAGIYSFVKNVIGKAIGLDTLTPHQFRHHYAVWLLSLGLDQNLARNLTGHKSVSGFERYIKGNENSLAVNAFRKATGEK